MDTDVPGLILSQTSVTVEEGGIAAYTVKLATQPTAPVIVTLTQPATADVAIVIAALAVVIPIIVIAFRVNIRPTRGGRSARGGEDSKEQSRRGKSE